jgi:hypothetical protein
MRRTRNPQIARFKKAFLQIQKLPFNDFFPSDVISDIIKLTRDRRGSIFTPLVTLKTFIFQVLSDDGSCQRAVGDVLAERLSQGQSANSVNTGPYCKARNRLPLEPIIQAVKKVGMRLHQQIPKVWQWKGYRVVLLDGTTVLMPDTADNQKDFPQQTHQKPGLGFPIARMVGLISLTAGTLLDFRLSPYQGKGSGETSLFAQLMSSLNPGDLLLADRYYCTFAIIALLQAKGIPVLMQNHAQKKTDFRRGKRLGQRDHWIDWQKPKRKPVWLSEQEYAELPQEIRVREFSAAGRIFISTLMADKPHHKQDLATLYLERWKIELDFRTLKTHMGMEMLRCKTAEMVKKEIAVNLLAYNLIRGNMAQAAILGDKLPRQISFRSAVQFISEITSDLLSLTGKTLQNILLEMLKAIASVSIGRQKRKRQPRAVKRRPKAYPLLTVPRHEACVTI